MIIGPVNDNIQGPNPEGNMNFVIAYLYSTLDLVP